MIAVPGELKGLWELHQKYGKNEWSQRKAGLHFFMESRFEKFSSIHSQTRPTNLAKKFKD